jgi:two-component system, cell cycle response regulator DivK
MTNYYLKKTILVAEDFDDTRFMLRYALESYGYQVLEATDGYGAVEIVKRERPNLILMDLNMPNLNGLAATRLIREQDELKDIPIIIVSGYDSYQHRNVALAAGCTEFLQKPIDINNLNSIISRLSSMDKCTRLVASD